CAGSEPLPRLYLRRTPGSTAKADGGGFYQQDNSVLADLDKRYLRSRHLSGAHHPVGSGPKAPPIRRYRWYHCVGQHGTTRAQRQLKDLGLPLLLVSRLIL